MHGVVAGLGVGPCGLIQRRALVLDAGPAPPARAPCGCPARGSARFGDAREHDRVIAERAAGQRRVRPVRRLAAGEQGDPGRDGAALRPVLRDCVAELGLSGVIELERPL